MSVSELLPSLVPAQIDLPSLPDAWETTMQCQFDQWFMLYAIAHFKGQYNYGVCPDEILDYGAEKMREEARQNKFLQHSEMLQMLVERNDPLQAVAEDYIAEDAGAFTKEQFQIYAVMKNSFHKAVGFVTHEDMAVHFANLMGTMLPGTYPVDMSPTKRARPRVVMQSEQLPYTIVGDQGEEEGYKVFLEIPDTQLVNL